MLYRVKETFKYEPAYGRVDDESITTVFNKGEIYEFEPYTGRCCKPGEMYLVTKIEPKMNQNWVWKPDYIEKHFEIVMSKLNLAEILKDCPAGTELWSPLFGLGKFITVVYADKDPIHVQFKAKDGTRTVRTFSSSGLYFDEYEGEECVLFPSRDNRDWSTFKVEKPKFDVSSLQPFDKVLVRDGADDDWQADFFSHISDFQSIHSNEVQNRFFCVSGHWGQCVPYNEETKHLIGTTKPAPEFYVTWEK